MSKTILRQIITQCAGTQDIIKKLASCDPCGIKSGLKTVAFLLRLSIYWFFFNALHLFSSQMEALPGKLNIIRRSPSILYISASLAMSTRVLKALHGKLDFKRHSPSILNISRMSPFWISVLLGSKFQFHSNFESTNSAKHDQTDERRLLFCLPLSHKKGAKVNPLLHTSAFGCFWNLRFLKILWKIEHLLMRSK